MILLIDAKKGLVEIQELFLIKSNSKLDMEANFLNLIKGI